MPELRRKIVRVIDNPSNSDNQNKKVNRQKIEVGLADQLNVSSENSDLSITPTDLKPISTRIPFSFIATTVP